MVLEKNGLKMEARNANQASAFLKSGWTELTDKFEKDANMDSIQTREWTKTEIYHTPVDELRKLAAENDIEDVDKINGSDLKKALIEKLGL